jgi:hypothetical protein
MALRALEIFPGAAAAHPSHLDAAERDNLASVDTGKPASRGRSKTGQWERRPKHGCCTAVDRD